jgi:hypothetical protein
MAKSFEYNKGCEGTAIIDNGDQEEETTTNSNVPKSFDILYYLVNKH